MSPDREQADVLLRKAREDQAVVVKLADDPSIADRAIGFQCPAGGGEGDEVDPGGTG